MDLQPLNTLAIPARAAHFVTTHSIAELCEALTWADENRMPAFVLGGGSNVVLKDVIEGLVVSPSIKGVELKEGNNSEIFVTAGAGENWHALVETCVNKGAYGLENLALIPGSVGAAPIQNIGAYGVELKDVFVSLEALNRKTKKIEVFTADACEFAYRDSVFKQGKKDQYIIVKITVRLNRGACANISYPALATELERQGISDPQPKDVFSAVVSIRQKKLPDPKNIPNAGSFFKNPVVSEEKYQQLFKVDPKIVAFPFGAQKKLAAAWLIDSAGWKGREINGVRVHQEQALVLTNPGKSSAARLLEMAKAIQADVVNRFGIELEMEPQIFG